MAITDFSMTTPPSPPINPTGPEPARTQAVMNACEADFNLMSGWFANTALDVGFPIPVNVTAVRRWRVLVAQRR